MKIIKRIEEIDNFYEDNFEEERIFLFEQAKIKLKRLLSYDVNMLITNENLTFVDFRVVEFNSNQ